MKRGESAPCLLEVILRNIVAYPVAIITGLIYIIQTFAMSGYFLFFLLVATVAVFVVFAVPIIVYAIITDYLSSGDEGEVHCL